MLPRKATSRFPSLGHPVDVVVEVPHHGVDEEARVLVGQRGGGSPQRPVADVERHVAAQPPGPFHGIEQDP